MDYSSSIHETDDPVAGSPWGNSPGSSPQANRTGFGNIAAEQPAPPFGGLNSQSSAGEGDQQRPGTATTASGTEGETEGSTATNQSAPESIAESQAATVEDEDSQQPRKPSQPQFRLQAKITGLERTGKKDPVLRFDVHVRLLFTHLGQCIANMNRQTSRASAPPSTEMFDASTPSSTS